MTGLMKRSGKRTVCGMVSSRNRKPPCGKKLVWQRLCTMRRLLCLYSNRPLRELSGLEGAGSFFCAHYSGDILRREKLRRRDRAGIHLDERVHCRLIAMNCTEQLLHLRRRWRQRGQLTGEFVHRQRVLVTRALMVLHRRIEPPLAGECLVERLAT